MSLDYVLQCSYMRTFKPTAVREDYLRAIFKFQEKGARSIKLVDVGACLGLSRSTVSERVQELSRAGYLLHSKYGRLQLTRHGYSIAKKLTHKHRIIEVFLHDVLRIPKNEVHAEAHSLEHALSDRVIKRLSRFLGNPTIDSHGAPIPVL